MKRLLGMLLCLSLILALGIPAYGATEEGEPLSLDMQLPTAALRLNETRYLEALVTNRSNRPVDLSRYSLGVQWYNFLDDVSVRLVGSLQPGKTVRVSVPVTLRPFTDICSNDPVMAMQVSFSLMKDGRAAVMDRIPVPVETLPMSYRTGQLRFLDSEGREVFELYTEESYTVELSFTNRFDFDICALAMGDEYGVLNFRFSGDGGWQKVLLPMSGNLPLAHAGQRVTCSGPLDFTNYLKKFPSGGRHHVSYDLIHVVSPDELPPLDVEPVSIRVIVGADPSGFSDVPSGAYYSEAVRWAVRRGIAAGTGPNTFSPNARCTRAQAVSFLWRAAGCPKPMSRAGNPFRDVSAAAYYADAVLWAVEQGITKGTGPDTFSPNAECTRAQIVCFLWNNAGRPHAGIANPFDDVAQGRYFEEAILWAVEQGIARGLSDTTFGPNAKCTRGQIACFLYNDAEA